MRKKLLEHVVATKTIYGQQQEEIFYIMAWEKINARVDALCWWLQVVWKHDDPCQLSKHLKMVMMTVTSNYYRFTSKYFVQEISNVKPSEEKLNGHSFRLVVVFFFHWHVYISIYSDVVMQVLLSCCLCFLQFVFVW